MEPTDSAFEVRTYFVRGKNALVARADFGALYADLCLHEMDCGIRHPESQEQWLRDALAGITLHAASIPLQETLAWTVHFEEPAVNVFVTAVNPSGSVTGSVHTEEVRSSGKNLFYAQTAAAGKEARLSVVDFEGLDVLSAAEAYYGRSEQRPIRIFRYAVEDLVMVSAQPDCDLDWLASLNQESILTLDKDFELSLLEQRTYRFACGCGQGRMLDLLAPSMRADPDALFGDQESLRMRCPRCGARHAITREALEAHIAAS